MSVSQHCRVFESTLIFEQFVALILGERNLAHLIACSFFRFLDHVELSSLSSAQNDLGSTNSIGAIHEWKDLDVNFIGWSRELGDCTILDFLQTICQCENSRILIMIKSFVEVLNSSWTNNHWRNWGNVIIPRNSILDHFDSSLVLQRNGYDVFLVVTIWLTLVLLDFGASSHTHALNLVRHVELR